MNGRCVLVVIKVPGSPDRILAPNRRAHGRAKAAATAQHRGDAKYAALAVMGGMLLTDGGVDIPLFTGPVAVSLLVRWAKGARSKDLDSVAICCKPFCDGLTDAKIWDDDRQIAKLTIQQERDATGKGEVVITVEEMP